MTDTPRVVLFDIDGTLLRTGGAGRRTMNQIFHQLWGVDDAFEGVSADGKTDPMIFREMLRRHEVEVEEERTAIAEIRRRYEAGFEAEMATSPAMLMPGVESLLAALNARADVAVGLLTGNLEITARIKVEHFGLGGYFPFGAFSSDHEVRRRLPPVAVRRASRWMGQPIRLGRHVAVLGDTPHDIDCALANGCTAVGVATARYTSEELRAAGAHITLADLSSTRHALAAFGL